MKLKIAFLLLAFEISTILSTAAPVTKKLKNDWAQHKALFNAGEEAARRKASLAKSDKIISDHNGNLYETYKVNHAKSLEGKNQGVIKSAAALSSALSGRAAPAHFPLGNTKSSTTLKPTTAAPVNQKLEKSWTLHMAKFHLKFDSAKEEAFRKDLFAKTDALIEKHNSDPKATFQMGHNQFSTMTEEEKKLSLGRIRPPGLLPHPGASFIRSAVSGVMKPTTTSADKKVKNDWAQHKALFNPVEEDARRKASIKDGMTMQRNSDPNGNKIGYKHSD